MTSDSFRAAGEALYGSRWVAEMARALHCSTRSVRRWSAGSWPVPMGVEHDLALMVSTRAAELGKMSLRGITRIETVFEPKAAGAARPPRWMIDEERAKLERDR